MYRGRSCAREIVQIEISLDLRAVLCCVCVCSQNAFCAESTAKSNIIIPERVHPETWHDATANPRVILEWLGGKICNLRESRMAVRCIPLSHPLFFSRSIHFSIPSPPAPLFFIVFLSQVCVRAAEKIYYKKSRFFFQNHFIIRKKKEVFFKLTESWV